MGLRREKRGGGEGALNELSLSAAHSPACSRGFLKALFAKKPLLDLLCRYGCSFRPPSPSARSFAMQPKERKPSSHCCHARKGACKAVRGEEKAIFEGVALYGYESLLVFFNKPCELHAQKPNSEYVPPCISEATPKGALNFGPR